VSLATLPYRAARELGRLVLAVYFRRIERFGLERFPAGGPVLVAANHPQSVTDALVLGLGLPRPVHFLAHSGLFRSPLRALALRAAGVIPVYRPADEAGAAARNATMFQACWEVLERGEAIAVFPEGVSREEPSVQKLKTGTARIALEAEDRNGFGLGVRIVPVGIAFESARRFRSRVALCFAEPLLAGGYRELYAADPALAVRSLTDALRQRLIDATVHLDRAELAPLAGAIEAVYRDRLENRVEPEGESAFHREVILKGEIARAVEVFQTRHPEALRDLAARMEAYVRQRERLHLSEEVLRAGAPSFPREAAGAAPLLLALPVAAWGAFWNLVPYRAVGWAADRLAADATKIHWTRIWLGTLVYTLYYVPLLFLAFRALGPVGGSAFGASLLPTGLYARRFSRVWERRRAGLRFALLAGVRRAQVLELRARRRRLVRTMDGLLDAYLDERGGGPAGPGALER
jgi:1-acyl-sn-glycerol-3-phosphate acyltransferase